MEYKSLSDEKGSGEKKDDEEEEGGDTKIPVDSSESVDDRQRRRRVKIITSAAEHLHLGLSKNPMRHADWFLLGSMYRQINRYADALNAFTRVVQLSPKACLLLLSKIMIHLPLRKDLKRIKKNTVT